MFSARGHADPHQVVNIWLQHHTLENDIQTRSLSRTVVMKAYLRTAMLLWHNGIDIDLWLLCQLPWVVEGEGFKELVESMVNTERVDRNLSHGKKCRICIALHDYPSLQMGKHEQRFVTLNLA